MTQYTPVCKNIVTNLDEFGLIVGLKRNTGESLVSYRDRILLHTKNPPTSTVEGLRNGISNLFELTDNLVLSLSLKPIASNHTISTSVSVTDTILYDSELTLTAGLLAGKTLQIGTNKWVIKNNTTTSIEVINTASIIQSDWRNKPYYVYPGNPKVDLKPGRLILYSDYIDTDTYYVDLDIEFLENEIHYLFELVAYINRHSTYWAAELSSDDYKYYLVKTLYPQTNIKNVTEHVTTNPVRKLEYGDIVSKSLTCNNTDVLITEIDDVNMLLNNENQTTGSYHLYDVDPNNQSTVVVPYIDHQLPDLVLHSRFNNSTYNYEVYQENEVGIDTITRDLHALTHWDESGFFYFTSIGTKSYRTHKLQASAYTNTLHSQLSYIAAFERVGSVIYNATNKISLTVNQTGTGFTCDFVHPFVGYLYEIKGFRKGLKEIIKTGITGTSITLNFSEYLIDSSVLFVQVFYIDATTYNLVPHTSYNISPTSRAITINFNETLSGNYRIVIGCNDNVPFNNYRSTWGDYFVDYAKGTLYTHSANNTGARLSYQYSTTPYYVRSNDIIVYNIGNEDFLRSKSSKTEQIEYTQYINKLIREDSQKELYEIVNELYGKSQRWGE